MRSIVPMLVLAGCGADLMLANESAPVEAPVMVGGFEGYADAPEMEEAMDLDDGVLSQQEDRRARPAAAAKMAKGGRGKKDEGELAPAKPGDAKPEPAADEGRIRQWFPEAFLWQPTVETNGDGLASVDVRVPDQLTTWRVLALAHSREGQQAGATHTFDTRLPVSVDPVTPGWLYVGDDVVMASQVVSMGDPFSGTVSVRTGGSLAGSGGGAVALSAGGSRVVRAGITAEESGIGTVTAELRDGGLIDGAERKVVVHPTGRPITSQRGGVLSGPRTFTMSNREASEERVLVQVFPGPLAVLHSELERIEASPPGAYGYALIDGVRTLSTTAGIEVDEAQLRTLRIRSWQRLVRQARSPDGRSAATMLSGLRTPSDSLAQTTRDRLVRVVEQSQRGDGTWSTASRSTLQQVLVETAMTARTLPDSSSGARIRASGALERNLPGIDDPFTAAWVLASGVVDASLRPQLQETVLTGFSEAPDGTRRLEVPSGVLDPWGRRPTRNQALAVTWLALADRDDLDWRGDLVSELLQGWSADRGFGAGEADVVALDAVRAGLASLDKPVTVVLEVGGVEIARGQVDPAQPKVPALLEARKGGEVTVRAEPAVPGLAFVASHTAWVPFTGAEALPGVEVEVEAGPLASGREGWLTLTVSAPSGAEVELVQGLPAGTAAEVPAETVAMLASAAEVQQDRVVLKTRAFGAGEVLELKLRVTPSFEGRMSTRPLEVSAGGQTVQLPPLVWSVRGGEGS
ncbi:MAG: alpha-2-macroglobulin family protein [Myxococcota bacterium]